MTLGRGIRSRLFVALTAALMPAVAQAQAGFTQQAKLGATNVAVPEEQGYSVAVSANGNTAIVGAPADRNWVGAARVYVRVAGTWKWQGTLTASDPVGRPNQGPNQGNSVALSADGNTALVGGPADNDFTGAAWVYTRTGSIWHQQAKLLAAGRTAFSEQGWSVALSGDGNTALVGAFTGNGGIGATWVYVRSGATWTQQAKLVGLGVSGGGSQGAAVSLSSDGNTALVGGMAVGERSSSMAAAWVFTRSRGRWRQRATLLGNDAVPLQNFNIVVAVALSGDGNTALVGGATDDDGRGAAWVYARSRNGEWMQQGPKLVAKLGRNAPVPAAQGSAVSLSADGDTAIVGGMQFDNFSGAIWVYTRRSGVWHRRGTRLIGTGAVGTPQQGSAAALSADGSTAVIGGPGDANGVGAAWVYARPAFAGRPGMANCFSRSAAVLAAQYRTLKLAAATLGFADVKALKAAIRTFCDG